MTAALTVYQSSTLATDITNAGTLIANTTGGALTNQGETIGTAHGTNCYGQLDAGYSSWPSLGSIGSPDGNGWLWDVTTLEGQQIVAGNWTPTFTLAVSVGSIKADIYCRTFVWNVTSHTYTQLGSTMSLLNQTITTSTTTQYAFAATSQPAQTFNTGDKLYTDVWLNVTTNSTGSGTALVRIRVSSSATQGNTGAQIVTPGYQPPPAGSSASFTESLTVSDPTPTFISWPIDFLTGADSTLYAVEGTSPESLVALESMLSVDSLIPTEAFTADDSWSTFSSWGQENLTASDSALFILGALPLDGLSALDSQLIADSYLPSDTRLTAADSISSYEAQPYFFTELLSVTDSLLAQDQYDSVTETLYWALRAFGAPVLYADVTLPSGDILAAGDSLLVAQGGVWSEQDTIADSFTSSEAAPTLFVTGQIAAQAGTDFSPFLGLWGGLSTSLAGPGGTAPVRPLIGRYRANGTLLPDQPYLASAPTVMGMTIPASTSFVLLFSSSASPTTQNILASGQVVLLTFPLSYGRLVSVSVLCTSMLTSSLFQVTCTVLAPLLLPVI